MRSCLFVLMRRCVMRITMESPFSCRQHLMRRLCKAAKVKAFGFHSIRHLTASILFAAGELLWKIQGILRHKTPLRQSATIEPWGWSRLVRPWKTICAVRLKSFRFPKAKRPQRRHSEGVLYPDLVSGYDKVGLYCVTH